MTDRVPGEAQGDHAADPSIRKAFGEGVSFSCSCAIGSGCCCGSDCCCSPCNCSGPGCSCKA